MYLVLNLGLKSIRAIIFSREGDIVANVQKPLQTRLNGDFVEQSAEEWWAKGLEVVREASANELVRRSLRYLTVTSSSCCLVSVDDQNRVLHDAIMVSDKRAAVESNFIETLPSYALMQSIRDDYVVNSSLMLPKILWLKRKRPELFNLARYFLSPNDFFALKFTGKAVTDSLNAEKSFYIADDESYPLGLLNDLEIPLKKMPEVVPIGTKIKTLTDETKALLGFDSDQKVEYVVTTYDAICAFYGSGPEKAGDACDVSGTVTSLRALATGKLTNKTTNIFVQYQPEFDVSIVGGSNNLGGGLIEWCKQAFFADLDNQYEIMESEAKNCEIGAAGLIFLPYLMGERAPIWNDDARGVFFGLGRHHTRQHMTRAVFESAGFVLRSLLEEIEAAGCEVKIIKSSGGLSRIQAIAQIKADVTGKPVHIVDEFETTAMGAFMLMGMSSGLFQGIGDAATHVKAHQIVFPRSDAHQKYSEIYSLFKKVYLSLFDCFSDHSKLRATDIYSVGETIENM